MNGKFTHYLITRFNIVEKNRLWDKNSQPVLDAAWIKHRLDLFSRFCIPTVSEQTEKYFTWLIYLDIASEPTLVNTIRSLTSELTFVQLCFVEGMAGLIQDLNQHISNSDTPFIITSRVDNDDGLGRDYIRIIQEHFHEEGSLLINLCGGIVYDIDQHVLTQMNFSERNHYGSLIEARNLLKDHITIFGFHHPSPPKEIPILNIHTEGSWLKIIHTRNARSQLKGKPVFTKHILIRFALPAGSMTISYPNTFKYIWSRVKAKILDNRNI